MHAMRRGSTLLLLVIVASCAANTAGGTAGKSQQADNPVTAALAGAAGCSRTELDVEWRTNRYGPVQTGDSLCVALGRWGQPTSLNTSEGATGSSFILQWGLYRGLDVPYSLTLSATKFS